MIRTMTGLLLVTILAVSGCRTAAISNPQNVAFATPSAATSVRQARLSDYQNAIVRAGAKRGWTFEEAGPGHLIGKVNVRGKHYAEVDVLFDQKAFSINYRNSQNLDYSAENKTIHQNYNSWVDNLRKEIQTEITLFKTS